MKRMKKFFSFLTAAAVLMVMTMAAPTFAANEGSIKITNATNGQKYTAYKIFDATASGNAVAYTTNDAGKTIIESDAGAPFTVSDKAGSNGGYNVKQKNGTTDADVVAWVSANYEGFTATGTEGAFDSTGSTYTISGLDLGYYYVTSSTGTVISLDTVTGANKEIKDKNTQGPNTPDKEIVAEDGTAFGGNGVKSNAAKVGSVETYTVSYNATNWVTSGSGKDVKTTQVKNFYIKDKPTGLAIAASTVKVKVNGIELGETAFSAAVDGSGYLTVTIPWVNDDNNSLYTPLQGSSNNVSAINIPVTVTYDATITSDAAAEAATNEAHIYYNHDSSSTSDGVEVTEPDNPPETTTYTYKFQLNKVDDNNAALKGAQFELYDGNTEVTLIKNDDGTYRVAASSETGVTTIDMSATSTAEIKGLDNKEYTLKEIKAPDGYTLADDTAIYPSNSDETGNKLVRVDGAYGTVAGDAGNVTVKNIAGSTLPSTGGIGTTIFYVLGALLIISAGVALIARRRMNSN